MILSVFLVLTGCMAGVDQSLDSASEMRAAVGRSALVVRETGLFHRDRHAVSATIEARAHQCLPGATLRQSRDGSVLVAPVDGESARVLVADIVAYTGGTRVTVTRGRAGHEAAAAAVWAWAQGNTRPCPAASQS